MNRRSAPRTARKPPQQLRSRATVEAILDATIRVFEREGFDAATTSRVAEVAGVSVGTLYQYFESRDAILDALQEREFQRATSMMQRLLGSGSPPDEQVGRAVVEALLRLYRAAPALHRVLALEGLRVTAAERVQAFDARIVATIRGFLSLMPSAQRRPNLDAAAFVVFQSVRASMLAYLLEQPPGVDDATLVDELSELILGYLLPPAEASA